MAKVLEKVIANQFLENHHLLDDLQGYGSSVEEQLCQAPELNQSINQSSPIAIIGGELLSKI